MVIIEFLGPIGKNSVKLDINSVEELSKFMANDKDLRGWVENSAIAVNDEIITDKNYKFKDGDRVSILPPVCGG
jgi:molybdopterin synthase sulfur carrier subunit